MPELGWMGDARARRAAGKDKGGDRFTNDASREKRTIGGVWAAASDNGRCVFLMATDAAKAGLSVGAQLRRAIGA